MTYNINLVIADDHPLLLKGLGDFLKGRGYRILKEATDGSTAWKNIVDLQPDVVILDIEMPYMSGMEIAQLINQKNLETKVILLSYLIEVQTIEIGRINGVLGFIMKEDALIEIEECLKAVVSGKEYISSSLVKKKAYAAENINRNLTQILTPTELKILKKIALNNSSKDIADSFNISERTIEKHRSNIIKKLELGNKKNALLSWAIELKDAILSL